MKRKLLTILLTAAIFGISCSIFVHAQPAGSKKRELLRVGVYDSRAIAVAYTNSDYWSGILKAKHKELEEAKAKGDERKIKELEAWGPAQQQKAHLRAFGTAPVGDCLKSIEEQMAQVAAAVGVDMIVSKWQIDYRGDDVQFVDLTDELAGLFKPNARALKSIESLKKVDPISEDEILRHEH